MYSHPRGSHFLAPIVECEAFRLEPQLSTLLQTTRSRVLEPTGGSPDVRVPQLQRILPNSTDSRYLATTSIPQNALLEQHSYMPVRSMGSHSLVRISALRGVLQEQH